MHHRRTQYLNLGHDAHEVAKKGFHATPERREVLADVQHGKRTINPMVYSEPLSRQWVFYDIFVGVMSTTVPRETSLMGDSSCGAMFQR